MGEYTETSTDSLHETTREKGPRISKIKNNQRIIALQEEGYYLKPELTSKTWKFQIDDLRFPKGRLCTFNIELDTPQKILTSRLGKPIRDAYKEMYYEKADNHLNETINLLQLYAQDFETDEPEPEYTPKTQESKADRLVNLALEANITLFRDQFGEQYARIPVKSGDSGDSGDISVCITPHPIQHTDIDNRGGGIKYENITTITTITTTPQVWPVKSEFFKQWLSGLMWTTDNEAVKAEHLKSAITVLCAMANEKPKTKLYNRVAPSSENGFYIDLTNDQWEAIHVTANGWEIVKPPVIFKRYPHQMPLCYPSENPDLSKLFKYINIGCIGDEERHINEQLLYLVGFLTAYIPEIPHVGTVLHGGAGHIKSMTEILTRKLIDPSSVEYNALPSKGKLTSLIQILEQHYYTVFDNLGDIDSETSDIFCRAITGAAFQLRKLFTDDEAYLRAYKRVINTNGINIPGDKPDFLDRVNVFEVPYVPMSKRRSETEVKAEFQQDAPDILAAILETLVKAIKKYSEIKLERLPRMADFTLWGCAVSEALGIPYTKFINAYYQNMLNVKGDVVKSRLTGQLLIDILDRTISDKNPSITYLVSKLFMSLLAEAKAVGIETRELPADPNRLGKELNIIASNLPSLGYSMTKKITNKGTSVKFSKLRNTTLDENLAGSPESYRNVWNVSDLRELLKPDSQVKTIDPPKPIQKQFDTIFGYIFDNGPVKDRQISRDLKIELPELRKLLAVLVKDGLIELLPPDKYRAKEVSE